MSNHAHTRATSSARNHYVRLLVMTVLSFAAMYVLMYAMVNRTDNALHNLNQVYMAGLMTSAMVLIELALMSSMYKDRRLNAGVIGVAVIALIACWSFTRAQTAIGDNQFLRSMIPHHAAAILMCQQASIQDAEIKRLCGNIISSQQAEIDQMQAKLREFAREGVPVVNDQ